MRVCVCVSHTCECMCAGEWPELLPFTVKLCSHESDGVYCVCLVFVVFVVVCCLLLRVVVYFFPVSVFCLCCVVVF